MPTNATKLSQQAADTFAKPETEELLDPQTTEDPEAAKLHNQEQAFKARYPDNFVQVREIFTDSDVEPLNDNLTDADRKRIAGFTVQAYQEELDKEKMAKIGYMIWQSKQLFYTAFRLIGWNETTKKMEWEQRDYTYHKLTDAQKFELKKEEAKLNALINKHNLFVKGYVNEALFNDLVTSRLGDDPVEVEIEEGRRALANKKFSFYFLEKNESVLNEIAFAEKRDLVEAAEYRETGVPFSLKLGSYRTMSGSAGAKAPSK